MKFVLLSNINLEYIIRKFSKNKHIECHSPDGYGVWQQIIMDQTSMFYEDSVDSIFIVLDAQELTRGCVSIEEKTKELKSIIESIVNVIKRQKNTKKIFISNLHYKSSEIKSLKSQNENKRLEYIWFSELDKLINEQENVYVFPLNEMIQELGSKEFYSDKLWYLGGSKYSIKAQNIISDKIELFLNSLNKKRKKCLVLDLDNTLWGGIIGEDGFDGIELSEFKEGARYKDFQKRIKELKEMGILLAICSKNNYDDAMEVIKKHEHMVLREEDFVCTKINWEPKTKNIKEIASELNIGIDSLVFIDDNPVEREVVRENILEVSVPEFPKDTAKLEVFAHDIYKRYFFTLDNTIEDKNKTKMYKDNVLRNTEKAASIDLESFYKGLNTEIFIREVLPEDIKRAAELTQKTNQFNLTTKRYTEKEISGFASSNNVKIYIASVSDKYGDNGKVSLVIVLIDDENAVFDSFIMSCRVMGRYIEDQIIDYIENDLKENGVKIIKAMYKPTKKNKPVLNFYDRLGYKIINESNGEKEYQLDLSKKSMRKVYGELIKK